MNTLYIFISHLYYFFWGLCSDPFCVSMIFSFLNSLYSLDINLLASQNFFLLFFLLTVWITFVEQKILILWGSICQLLALFPGQIESYLESPCLCTYLVEHSLPFLLKVSEFWVLHWGCWSILSWFCLGGGN